MESPSIEFTQSGLIRWSDYPDDPFTEEESGRESAFDTSLQRLLAWQANLKQRSFVKNRKESKRRSLSIEIPPTNFETMSWSSAAGKPQLTYAERLRRAKEGPRSAKEAIDGEGEENDRVDGNEKVNIIKSSLGINALSFSTPASTSSHGETGTNSSPAISSSNSPIPPPPSSVSSVQSPSVPIVVSATPQAVNVWETRKLQLQEMVKNAESQAINDEHDVIREHSTNGSLPLKPKENGMHHNEKMESRTSINEGRRGSTSEVDRTSSITEIKSDEKQKLNKNNKKKKQAGTNQKQQNSSTEIVSLPPLSDPTNWPSPIDAKDKVQQNASSSSSSSTKIGQTSSVSNETILNQLDVEILRQSGSSDKVRKGKQWIPIVPTITNPSSRSTGQQQQQQQQQQKRNNNNSNRRTTDQALSKMMNERRTVSDPQSTAPQSRLLRNVEMVGSGLSNGHSNENQSDDADQSSVDTVPTERMQKGGTAVVNNNNANASFDGQRRKSRTPRGARGRGGSKKSSDNEAITPSLSASTSHQNDSGLGVMNDARTMESSGGESFKAVQQRRDTMPNSNRQPPSAPRSSSQGGQQTGMRRSTVASERQFYDPNLMFFGGHHPPPPMMFNAPPFIQPGFGPFYPSAFGNGMPFVESTPAEFAPKGTLAETEPTSALLWQIEFYFSHQNLQGDFYLRKMMDAEGFVPIETLASFNRVKRLAGDNVDLIKETIQFSKALQISEDGMKIRKGFGWEPYVLVEGQHAQEWHPAQSPSAIHSPFPHQQNEQAMPFPPFNGGGEMPPPPLSPLFMNQMGLHQSNYPNRMQYSPQMRNSNFQQQQQQQQRNRYPPRTTTSGQQNTNQDELNRIGNSNENTDSLINATEKMNIHDNYQKEREKDSEQVEEEDDDDEEEPQLGVVAAAGLGGALNSTT